MAKTGDYGGQCVAYANAYFGSSLTGNGNEWYDSSSVTQLDEIQSGCAACWSGGKHGYGHVGVVEEWNGETMTYSDSNYKGDEKVIVRTDLSERDMKRFLGKTFTFQDYVIPD